MMLTKNQRGEIRNEANKRYPKMDRVVSEGRDAPKAYGAWAGPTIHALLDTCDELEAKIKELEFYDARCGVSRSREVPWPTNGF
jgi:hypothetical protein